MADIVPMLPRQLACVGYRLLPETIATASEKAGRRFIEFFTANIRNRNTPLAYGQAVYEFFAWCEGRGLRLQDIELVIVAGYIEEHQGAMPTVKQHLAAIRMLFDYRVTGGVLPMNPASSVRGPKHVVKPGKTSVLTPDEAREILDSIETSSIVGPRDRALIGVMVYTFARVGAVVTMKVEDYYQILVHAGAGVVGRQGAVRMLAPAIHHRAQRFQRRALVNGLHQAEQERLSVSLAQPLDPGVTGRRPGASDQRLGVRPQPLGDVYQEVIPANADAEVDVQPGERRLLVLVAQRKIAEAGRIGDEGFRVPQRV